MRYTTWALWAILFVLPIRTNAIEIRVAAVSETTADLTVDWSDATVGRVNVSQADLWSVIYDRFSGPVSFINIAVFTVTAAWPAIYLQCTWEEPPPQSLHLAYYNIWTPNFASIKEQSATAITFHLDRDPAPTPTQIVAVPESGSSILLLLTGLAATAMFRYRFVSHGVEN